MDRGRVRPPRSRCRLIILMTVTGLAMTALFPAVRSTPGLAMTPRRIEAPTPLAFGPADADESDFDPTDPASFLENGQEGSAGDPEESSAEESAAADWLATRPSRGRAADRSRAIWGVATTELLPSPRSGRPPRRPAFVIGSPHVGLSVRLCRLLF